MTKQIHKRCGTELIPCPYFDNSLHCVKCNSSYQLIEFDEEMLKQDNSFTKERQL